MQKKNLSEVKHYLNLVIVMSRVGKQTVQIPENTQVNFSGLTLSVKGPRRTQKDFKTDLVAIEINGNKLLCSKNKEISTKALWNL